MSWLEVVGIVLAVIAVLFLGFMAWAYLSRDWSH